MLVREDGHLAQSANSKNGHPRGLIGFRAAVVRSWSEVGSTRGTVECPQRSGWEYSYGMILHAAKCCRSAAQHQCRRHRRRVRVVRISPLPIPGWLGYLCHVRLGWHTILHGDEAFRPNLKLLV